jgi:hypothetical protein
MRRSLVYKLLIFISVFIAGTSIEVHLVPVEDTQDGFAAQLAYTFSVLQSDSLEEAIQYSWLIFVHLARLLVISPFLFLDSQVGSVSVLLLMLLLLLPLTHVPSSSRHRLLLLLPMILPLFVSGRSVLVAVGVGYIIMYIIEQRSNWMLFIGVLLVNLSSASVLMSLLLLVFACTKNHFSEQPWKRARTTSVLVLSASLAISTLDKLAGFGSGEVGYETQYGESGNVVLTIISRSTLFVSIAEGQYWRFLFYLAVAIILFFKLSHVISNPRYREAKRIILCCVPGLFLEGLGVIAMVFPLIWLFFGLGREIVVVRNLNKI